MSLELKVAVAVCNMLEVAHEFGNLGLISDRVIVDGEPVTVHVTWDACIGTLANLEYGLDAESGERAVVADLRWSHNDGCLKVAVLDGGPRPIGSVHLAGITRRALIADWERVFGFPYNGELDEVIAA